MGYHRSVSRDDHRAGSSRGTEAVECYEGVSVGLATLWRLGVDLLGDAEGIQAAFGSGEAAARCRHLERNEIVGQIGTDPSSYQSVRHCYRN
ncbi:hypothetical protein SAMN04515672_2360 [Natronorubrum texcoconense]|uniref:Uncharacterized protein n=1 Tax=Natronorubrum texcoconense TaxID=1095776 RepID=A0A1G8ZKA7_9EURY|nr:hypothetical protein SAMN04515672_2360 [Natronorubrum texcoconense]